MRITTATRIGSRAENQDSMWVGKLKDGSTLVVVADGMGGHPNGRQAAEALTAVAAEYLEKALEREGQSSFFSTQSIQRARIMASWTHRMNDDVRNSGGGTVASFAIINPQEDRMVLAGVGDCIALTLKKSAGLRRFAVLQPISRHNVGHSVLRFFGKSDHFACMEWEELPFDDGLLLGSDGCDTALLHGRDDWGKLVWKQRTVYTASDLVEDCVQSNSGSDNVTAVLVMKENAKERRQAQMIHTLSLEYGK